MENKMKNSVMSPIGEAKDMPRLGSRNKMIARFFMDNNSLLILVVLLFVAFIAIDGFTGSFYNVILYSSLYGTVCLGLALIMITGNIDLSLGYLATLSGVTFVLSFNLVYASSGSEIAGIIVGLIVALLTGFILGTFNGFIVTKIGISPLIATLATNYVFQGFVYNFAQTSYAPTAKDMFTNVSKFQIGGLKWFTPMVIIMALFVIGVLLWMYKFNYGNRLHVVGDNPEAAEYAGISVSKTVFVTFIIAGVFAAVTGILTVSFSGYAIYTQGEFLGTFPISCCILGGIKMTGGKGTAIHVLLGILIMRSISTIMNVMFLSAHTVNLITGLLLVIILIIDRLTSTKKES